MNGSLISRSVHNRKGQDMVELALFLPLLLMLTLGVVDLGRALGVYVGLKNAAREGARYISLYASEATVTGVQDRVINEAYIAGANPLSRSDVIITPSTGWSDGRSVTLRVNFNFRLLTTALLGLDTVPLHASTEMVIIGGP